MKYSKKLLTMLLVMIMLIPSYAPNVSAAPEYYELTGSLTFVSHDSGSFERRYTVSGGSGAIAAVFGTASWASSNSYNFANNATTDYRAAFDGTRGSTTSNGTYFDGRGSDGYCGVEFHEPTLVARIGYLARSGQPVDRLNGAIFEGSDDNIAYEPLLTLNGASTSIFTYRTGADGLKVVKPYKFYRLRGHGSMNGNALNIQELKLFTYMNDEALMEAISVPQKTTSDITLPSQIDGHPVSWSTSDPSVMSSDGKLMNPDRIEDEYVILTAALTYDGTKMKKSFLIIIPAPPTPPDPEVLYKLNDSGMDNVTLHDSWLVNATQKDLDYCLSLDAEMLLYWYYTVAGVTPKTDSSYPNWERGPAGTPGGNAQNFRGFTLGRLMAALSQLYLSTKDDPVKNAAVLAQIKICINGLKECQDTLAASNPSIAGYVSSFPETRLDSLQDRGTNSDPLVPFWILDSMLTGICDVAKYVDDDPIGETAYTVAARFGEYLYKNRTSKWTAAQKATVQSVEYGGMNIALYMLYDLTGNPQDKFSAEQFDETSLFDPIANGQDVLSGKHANTQIPKFVGAMKRYAVMTRNPAYYAELTDKEKEELETRYLAAAKGFWTIVTENHSYITGGNSQGEHFREANSQGQYYTSDTTCETCNTYNMLRLTRELFKVTKDKKYADFYENTYTNAILSSQNPETGMFMYFQPMSYGFNKVFSPPDRFWCCVGTGMDSFSKLNDSLYFTEDNSVFVNLYYSSEYRYAAQNLKLSQQAKMPNSDKVSITIDSIDGNAVAAGTDVYFRVPDWCDGYPTVKINGSVVNPAIIGGYILAEDVEKGDAIELTFPMTVTLHELPNNKNVVAYKYGPTVLSCGQGTWNMAATSPNGILVLVAQRATEANGGISSITVNNGTVAEWKKNIANKLVRIEDSEDGRVQFKLQGTNRDETLIYSPHYMRYAERYGIYIPLLGTGEYVGVAQSISVSAQEIAVSMGQKKNITALVTFADGHQEDVTSLATYKSSKNDVCTVTNGVIEGVRPGVSLVTVSYSGVSGGTVSVSLLVTVTADPYFTGTDGENLTALTSMELNATLPYKNESVSNADLTMYVAVYSQAGQLMHITSVSESVDPNEMKLFKATLNLPDNIDGSYATQSCYAAIYLWGSDNYVPVIEKVTAFK